MTLLGVGGGAGSLAGNTTTLGRIGSGYMYADWKSQVAYTSPNWNGFNFTVGVTQAFNAIGGFAPNSSTSSARGEGSPAFEGKAAYAWTGDVAGKVWASFISQKVEGLSNAVNATFNPITGVATAGTANTLGANASDRATAFDVGTTVNVAGFGLTAYYGQGSGIGQTGQLVDGFDRLGKDRDSDQWYLQGTYTLPTVGTKLGLSYGESTLDGNSGADTFNDIEDSLWVVGAYHPLTKHLNLVAEYSQSERDVDNRGAAPSATAKAKTISLGAILFF